MTSSGKAAPSAARDRASDFIAPATLLLAALLAYQNSFSVPLFFDDVVAIVDNPSIRDLRRIGEVLSPPADGGGIMGRPIVNLSLALNYALGGTTPAGYHVFNLVVHGLAAIGLFGLLRRTFLSAALRTRLGAHATPLAFVTSLLWTVHPLQSESVSCVIQRTELLVGLFYVWTLYAFARAAEEPASRRWPAFAIVCCALGMASKEVMVSAPLVAFLFDRTFLAGTFRAAWQQRRGLHLGLAATWLVLGGLLAQMGGARGAAAGFGLGVSAWTYLLKQCEAIVLYARLSLWPHPLIIDYGTAVVTDPWQVVPEGLLLLGALVFTGYALVRRPVVGFAFFATFAILAPSSSFVPLVSQTVAEHRMYLPLAAVLALAVTAAYRQIGARGWTIAAVAAAALGVVTFARNMTLQDVVGLWTDTVAKIPANARAHGSLGLALTEQGRLAEALPHFSRALELDPRSVATHQNIGNVYFQRRDFAAAADHFRHAVRLDPSFASGFNNLGATLWELRDTDGALESYRAALAIKPRHVGAHQNIARALFALGQFSDAARHYEALLRETPASAQVHYDAGLAYARAGDVDRAATHFSAALRLRPSPGSYLNYARFLAQAGRTNEAIASLETALRLQPDFPDAQRELERLRGR